ncbi:MAG: hypothetical protein AB7N76_06535 [Planctomycetota bacterium]
MDETLRELERAAQAEPSDPDVARRLERALRAGGETERLEARFRFKFQCPLRFEDLRAGEVARERLCQRCGCAVVHVRDAAELRDAVAGGRCVAFFERDLKGAFAALAADERLCSAEEQGAPCVVPSEREAVRLAEVQVEPGLPSLFDPWLLRRYTALPLRIREGVLEVAWASSDRPDRVLLDALRLTSGARQVRFLLAERAEVEEALERVAPEPMLMGIVVPFDEPEDGAEDGAPPDELGPRVC